MSRMKEYVRTEVLLKAMNTFWKKGYKETSMQDLVDQMGINRFSIYSDFKSKRHIYLEALEVYYQQKAVPLFAMLNHSKEGIQSIETLLNHIIPVTGEIKNKGFGCMIYRAMHTHNPVDDDDIHKLLQRFLSEFEDAFLNALKRAKKLGELKKEVDIKKYAKLLTTYTSGLVTVSNVVDKKHLKEQVVSLLEVIK
ncbi:MAG: TetR/AcrR family transcriptional regulator [Candidatus Omnitrophica bacterium]|nr:TetR/AcrR family transcriptional regulator [Candidatus Omnitrophota bacterium]